MRYISPDGENGFPGELTLDVTYTLTQKQDLRIDYKATTTKPTVVNIANHNFFNLTGDHASNVLEEELWLDADSFAVYDMSKRVTGKLAAVKDTPFDFRTPHLIGERIDTPNNQLNITKGYDHCYILNTNGDLSRLAARLVDNHTDITVEVYTTEPALQIYTANGHKGNMIGKNGKPHNRRNAVCLETMHFPDSPNNPQWPSTILRPGETFRSTTIFHFN
jgi:aldose 1-epimerase